MPRKCEQMPGVKSEFIWRITGSKDTGATGTKVCNEIYSLRNDFTGLAKAARHDCPAVVKNAIINKAAEGNR